MFPVTLAQSAKFLVASICVIFTLTAMFEPKVSAPLLNQSHDFSLGRLQMAQFMGRIECSSISRRQNIGNKYAKSQKLGDSRILPLGLHAYGLCKILHGEIEVGVRNLADAVDRDPGNLVYQNDLAAGYLLLGDENPLIYLRALSAADKALKLNRRCPEANLNLAIALEKLHLPASSRKAWENYLSTAPDSQLLAMQAQDHVRSVSMVLQKRSRNRLDKLSNKELLDVANVNPLRVQRYVIENLLVIWGKGITENDQRQARVAMEAMTLISKCLGGKHTTDSALMELTRDIESAGFKSRRDRLGYFDFARAMGLYKEGRYAEAYAVFKASRKRLVQGKRRFNAWASLYLGICLYQEANYQKAMIEFENISSHEDPSNSLGVLEKSLWMEGLIFSLRGSFAEALEHYSAALSYAQKFSDYESMAAIQSRIGGLYSELGEPGLAWKYAYRALGSLENSYDYKRLQYILEEMVDATSRLGEDELITYFYREAIQASSATRDPVLRASLYRDYAAIAAKQQKLLRALAAISRAKQEANEIPDEGVRQVVSEDIDLVAGSISASRDPVASLELLQKALVSAKRARVHFRVAEIYLGMARAHLALRHSSQVKKCYEYALQERERERGNIGISRRRVFFESSRSLFDDLIRIQVDQYGDFDEAFNLAERSRARVLWDLFNRPRESDSHSLKGRRSGVSSKLATLDTVRARVPAEVDILSFRVIGDEILVWLVNMRGVYFYKSPVGVNVAKRHLSNLLRDIKGRAPSDRVIDSALFVYDDLLGPISQELRPNGRLVIIPDGFVFGVPFSVLVGKGSGHYLIEDHVINVVPSATIYLGLLEQRQLNFKKSRVLLISNSSVNRRLFPEMPDLPNVDDEVRQIAREISGSTVKSGDVTAKFFLASLRRFEVLHFAGHAVVNFLDPSRSLLILGNRESDLLSFADIVAESSGSTQLVVLSACRTSTGEVSTEGLMDLTYPFIANKAQSVVGSLWDVDDRAATELFTRFYAFLAQGISPSQALRLAQLEFSRSAIKGFSNPSIWAAFVDTGSV